MFIEDACYPVAAWAIEETSSCGIRKSDFEQVILAHPAIGLRVIRKQGEQIASLTARLGDMAIPLPGRTSLSGFDQRGPGTWRGPQTGGADSASPDT